MLLAPGKLCPVSHTPRSPQAQHVADACPLRVWRFKIYSTWTISLANNWPAFFTSVKVIDSLAMNNSNQERVTALGLARAR